MNRGIGITQRERRSRPDHSFKPDQTIITSGLYTQQDVGATNPLFEPYCSCGGRGRGPQLKTFCFTNLLLMVLVALFVLSYLSDKSPRRTLL